MRTLGLIAGFMMIASCYAYKVITLEDSFKNAEICLTENSLKLQQTIDARLPAKSEATAGAVSRHTVENFTLSNAIFIIGDDQLSRQWLSEHAAELRGMKALGFVTNIENSDSFNALQDLAGTPLLPANVDDLLALLGASHYPLIFSAGDVWQ